jgi:hypothetical protein
LTEEKRDDSFMYLVISYMTKETKIHTTALLETLQTWQALLNDLLGLQQLTWPRDQADWTINRHDQITRKATDYWQHGKLRKFKATLLLHYPRKWLAFASIRTVACAILQGAIDSGFQVINDFNSQEINQNRFPSSMI